MGWNNTGFQEYEERRAASASSLFPASLRPSWESVSRCCGAQPTKHRIKAGSQKTTTKNTKNNNSLFVFFQQKMPTRVWRKILSGNFIPTSPSTVTFGDTFWPFSKNFHVGCETAPFFWHFFGEKVFGHLFGCGIAWKPVFKKWCFLKQTLLLLFFFKKKNQKNASSAVNWAAVLNPLFRGPTRPSHSALPGRVQIGIKRGGCVFTHWGSDLQLNLVLVIWLAGWLGWRWTSGEWVCTNCFGPYWSMRRMHVWIWGGGYAHQ